MPKSQRLSDATLVRRSQQGDRKAFGALASRYDRRLRGLAHALLLDRAQMDAALGLAYLRAWRDVVRIKPRDDVGPWLYRAVYNACIDQLRRGGSPNGDRPAPVDPSTAPDGLRAALARLAPADRVAVVLVEREGFSVASAARILGVLPDELETRLDLARDRLAAAVSESSAASTLDEQPVPVAVASGNGHEPPDVEPDEDAAAPSSSEGDAAAAGDTNGAADGANIVADAAADQPASPAKGDPASAAQANGHRANRGRGRRARRRANGAAAAAPVTSSPATDGPADDGAATGTSADADPAPSPAEPESSEVAESPGDGPDADTPAPPAATAPAASEHQAVDR